MVEVVIRCSLNRIFKFKLASTSTSSLTSVAAKTWTVTVTTVVQLSLRVVYSASRPPRIRGSRYYRVAPSLKLLPQKSTVPSDSGSDSGVLAMADSESMPLWARR